jgi:hypothetical protein
MRRNNPYFGYVPPDNTLDWAKLTGGLVDTITGISEERKEERNALDQINIENQKIVSTVDRYADPTLDQFVLSASEQGRLVMKTWNTQLKNREIKPAEYRNRMNNLMTNWAQFGTATKTFNSRIQEALKRQELNENGESVASGYELYKIKQLAEYGNLKNKKAFIDPQTGNIMSGVLNEQTGLVDPSTLVTGVALNNPENLQANKVNVNKLVSNSVKNWGDFTDKDGTITTSGKSMNPFLAKAMSTLTASIMTTPEAIASILDDNQAEYEIEYWTTQDERKSVINKMISEQNAARQKMGEDPMTEDESNKYIEENSWTMIQNSRDGNGVMRPLITKDQSDRAKEIIENNINAQLGKKTIPDKPVKPSTTSSPSEGGPTDAQINAQAKGAEIKQIMSGKFSERAAKLKIASGNQYDFIWNNSTKSYSAIKIGAKNPTFTGLKTSSDMYKIFSTKAQEPYYNQGTKSKTKTTFD